MCKTCGDEKDLSEFYKHKGMKDGHLNECISCTKARVLVHRGENLEKIRAYDRARGNRQSPEYIKEWREKYPNKYKANTMVNNAIRDGKLFKESCVECGSVNSVAHHDDYLKPLNVIWYCQAHHLQWHAKNGEGKNG